MYKKYYRIDMTKHFIILICLAFLSSCIMTKYVQRDRGYKETFYGYYLSKYNNDIVFLGTKYHYVFNDKSNQVAEFIKPKWKSRISISKISLSTDRNNNVNGYVILRLAEQQKLVSKDTYYLEKKILLNGVRYKPRETFNANKLSNFSQKYKTKIRYEFQPWEKSAIAALSPIATAADGAIILTGGIWVPLIIMAWSIDF